VTPDAVGRPRLTLRRPSGGRFQIGADALETLTGFIQNAPGRQEAGGVLLGRHIADSKDIVVDEVTMPMPGDRQRRFGFFRAAHRHQRAIDRAWTDSGGTRAYLGEWHTHPEPLPSPSLIDLVGWQYKLHFDQHVGLLFFVIVGTDAIAVWEGVRGRLKLSPLTAASRDVQQHAPGLESSRGTTAAIDRWV
jgi:integrative and conjugative element protein (TIGR02256 family)